jgi:rubrerythrin
MTNSESSPYMTCREFIDMAIEFEKESVEFYQALQKQVEPGAVAQLLQLLEQQEAYHVRKLQEWSPAEPEAMMQFSPSLIGNMPKAPDEPVNLSELIELAIERERIAKETYRSAARLVTGDFRAMIEAFAVFEEEHEEKLRSMRNI